MVTKAEVSAALLGWEIARARAALEHTSLGLVLESHKRLIGSMRVGGHSWARAKREFDKLYDGHRETHLAAMKEMDRKCKAYQNVAAAYAAQSLE